MSDAMVQQLNEQGVILDDVIVRSPEMILLSPKIKMK